MIGLCAGVLLLAASCEREERRLREASWYASKRNLGANAYALAEGQRLFQWFNCVGCHAHGGGGIGPPLMDDEWIHGSEPDVIFTVVTEGTRNGMPAFRGKISDAEAWQVVAYVRSLSGLVRADAAPGRSDHLQARTSAPPRQALPDRELREMRAAEDAALNSYGWVDTRAGIVRIPIDRAIEMLAARGLPHPARRAHRAPEACVSL
jgi:cytochrome c5